MKPLFSYTAYSAFIGLIVGVGLLTLTSVWAILLHGTSSSLGQKEIILTALFDLLLLAVSLVGLQRRVWMMRFYENSFTVRGRNLRKAFAYSQIETLHHYKIFTGFRGREIIIIDVDGEKSFAISANPSNIALGTNLYHWLVRKAPAQTTTEEKTTGVSSR